jgi:polyisoprenoid-binding protein YceI
MGWKVDPDRSKIEFQARHLRLTNVRGHFGSFQGSLAMNEEVPEASTVEGNVDVASIDTGLGLRDANLRAGGFMGFFGAKQYPTMSFRSTEVGPFTGSDFEVCGNLTIKDVTRPVVFQVVNRGEQPAADGKRRWRFDARLPLSRKQFNLKFNRIMELGGLLVADGIQGILQIEFVEE